MKRENPRTDIATRKEFPKSELLRLVLSDGVVLVDKEGRLPGRGYYLKPENLDLAIKKRVFLRLLHRELTEEELTRIKEAS